MTSRAVGHKQCRSKRTRRCVAQQEQGELSLNKDKASCRSTRPRRGVAQQEQGEVSLNRRSTLQLGGQGEVAMSPEPQGADAIYVRAR
jgi:hypothetical protein